MKTPMTATQLHANSLSRALMGTVFVAVLLALTAPPLTAGSKLPKGSVAYKKKGVAFDLNKAATGIHTDYVLDTNAAIRFAYSSDNYSVRSSQEALLKAAKEALGK